MRAIGIEGGKGSADDFFIEDNVPDPVANGDSILREDRYPYPLLPESGKILGVEFSGLVEALGPECKSDFQVGQRCFGLAYGGAYAEKISVSENMLMHMPDGIGFEIAAGFPETFFTAVQAIHLIGDLQPGQSVLIHAGSSGVGQAAIQVARCGGAKKIFVTAGSDDKCSLCKSLGADFAINYRTCGADDFAEVIHRETDGKGVELIIDLVGQSYWHRTTAAAAMEGRIVIVATMSGAIVDKFNFRDLMNKRLWVMTTTLRTRPADYQRQLRDVVIEKALPHFAKGEIKVTVDEIFPWSKISNAHKKMESNTHAGKLICNVEE